MYVASPATNGFKLCRTMGSHALSATQQNSLSKRLPTFQQDAPQFITAIPTDPASPWTKDTFIHLFDSLVHEDDVSEPEFRNILLFCGSAEGSIELPKSLEQHIHRLGLQYHVVEVNDDSHRKRDSGDMADVAIPGGAYLWANRRLQPVFRLYEDKQSCLVHYLLRPAGERQHKQLQLTGRNVQSFYAAVPSRIPDLVKSQSSKPFAGKRVLVKDVFDIHGIRTTLCDRAYYDMSSPAPETAPAIQMLIDQGAELVGTTKLSSMISWEEPSECMDYSAPFNPRGDNYQSPAGSSSGSAAAVAAYEWLDYAIGTDSTGSCRRPAMVNGCFAIRISKGKLPSEGMAPCFPLFDTPAVFARDISDLSFFVKHWGLDSLEECRQHPSSIILPLEYIDAIRSRHQRAILDTLVDDLHECTKIDVHRISLQALWDSNPPAEAGGQSLHEFLQDVGPHAFFFDFYHSTDQFRQNYFDKHHASPPVNRMTAYRWDMGSRITAQQRHHAGRRLEIYKTWLLSRLLCGENPIVVLPIMDAEPNYRDDQVCGLPTVQEAWDQLWLSPVLGSPEVTVPIGQIPYMSKKTGAEEVLPVAVSIMGLPGTDCSLVASVETMLRQSGRPLRVASGRQMFVEDWEVV
ncbi:hypothetical protein M409DRAFT_70333 [Zasmidium cellare ATCC 36951]|uniref:Amidase domain-containing protein n=1 Tax=Zasmidium cellare ATCC 36951 TaxID=1080233 RepID=A0A6A6C0K8_ZASCE|nr:uncharacterized protein M409DRAFT_70333 [Zasmidium cellare ATCC 36951]KAF2160587.1 hypothetical protein M409DRAFT_70333 [Zasmidium cellare ATCC 36951]